MIGRIRKSLVKTKFLGFISKLQGFTVNAYFLWPFWIFMDREKPEAGKFRIAAWEKMLAHESVHFYQSLCLGIIFFPIVYGGSFLVNLFIYKDSYLAYRNVVLEREAYCLDDEGEESLAGGLVYFFSFYKYFNKKYEYLRIDHEGLKPPNLGIS